MRVSNPDNQLFMVGHVISTLVLTQQDDEIQSIYDGSREFINEMIARWKTSAGASSTLDIVRDSYKGVDYAVPGESGSVAEMLKKISFRETKVATYASVPSKSGASSY